jgi:NAD-dependent deacetylase
VTRDPTGLPDPGAWPREATIAEARERIRNARGLLVLTGAGISAESGIPTFRQSAEGIWRQVRPEDLATPGAFARDPRRVWEWYDMRRRAVLACDPNPGHRAVARALLSRPDTTLVTQNVDGLHQRALEEEGAGASEALEAARDRILPLHGSLLEVKCSRCPYRRPDREPVDATAVDTLPRCPECGALLRPAVVWFGEMLPDLTLEAAFHAAGRAQVCVVAGTSALVHPAASVPTVTLRRGGDIVEVNPEETPLSPSARWRIRARAGRVLPELLRAAD